MTKLVGKTFYSKSTDCNATVDKSAFYGFTVSIYFHGESYLYENIAEWEVKEILENHWIFI